MATDCLPSSRQILTNAFELSQHFNERMDSPTYEGEKINDEDFQFVKYEKEDFRFTQSAELREMFENLGIEDEEKMIAKLKEELEMKERGMQKIQKERGQFEKQARVRMREIELLEKIREEKNAEILNKTNALRKQKMQMKMLQNKKVNVEKGLGEMKKNFENQKEKFENLVKKKNRMVKSIEMMKRELKMKDDELVQSAESLEEKQNKIVKKETELCRLRAAVEENESMKAYVIELEKQLVILKEGITSLRFENSKNESQNSQIQESVSKIEDGLRDLQKKYQEELYKLKESRRYWKEKMKEHLEMEREMGQLERERLKLKYELKSLKHDAKRSLEMKAALKDENTGLKEKRKQQNADMEKLRSIMSMVRREKKLALEKIDKLEKSKKNADLQLEHADGEMSGIVLELKKYKEQVMRSQPMITLLQMRQEMSQKQITDLMEMNQELKSDKSKLKLDCDAFKEEISSIKDCSKGYHRESRELKNQLATRRSEALVYSQNQKEIITLKKRIETLRVHLAKAKEESDDFFKLRKENQSRRKMMRMLTQKVEDMKQQLIKSKEEAIESRKLRKASESRERQMSKYLQSVLDELERSNRDQSTLPELKKHHDDMVKENIALKDRLDEALKGRKVEDSFWRDEKYELRIHTRTMGVIQAQEMIEKNMSSLFLDDEFYVISPSLEDQIVSPIPHPETN